MSNDHQHSQRSNTNNSISTGYSTPSLHSNFKPNFDSNFDNLIVSGYEPSSAHTVSKTSLTSSLSNISHTLPTRDTSPETALLPKTYMSNVNKRTVTLNDGLFTEDKPPTTRKRETTVRVKKSPAADVFGEDLEELHL